MVRGTAGGYLYCTARGEIHVQTEETELFIKNVLTFILDQGRDKAMQIRLCDNVIPTTLRASSGKPVSEF